MTDPDSANPAGPSAQQRFELLLDGSPEAALVIGRDEEILFANRAASLLFGRSADQLTGAQFGVPVANAGGTDIDVVLPDGTVRVAELRTMPVPWGSLQATVVSLRDVTPLRRAESALVRSEERFRVVFESAPVGMAICNLSGGVVDANSALCLLTGRDRGEIEHQPVGDLTHPDDRADERERFEALCAGELERYELETRLVGADGSDIPVQANMALVRDDEDVPDFIVAQFQDVSERMRLESRLRHMADHDPLTGLLNRGAFGRELTRTLVEGKRFDSHGALMMIDLDGLKQVNDTLGHRAGDDLLVAVGQAIKERLRDTDALSRLGGDEFALLLPRATRSDAEAVGSAVLEQIRAVQVHHPAGPASASASVGVAMLGSDIESAAAAFKLADAAMYDAKRRGGDRIVVAEAQLESTESRRPWSDELERALRNDGFDLHAQPIMSLGEGRMVRHELFLRGSDTNVRQMNPAMLVSVAERFHRIAELDRWSLNRTFELLAGAGSPDLQLDVNISGRSLGEEGFLEWIEDRLERQPIKPGQIGFDIAEPAILTGGGLVRDFSARVTDLGFRVTVDGFGSGLSSIQYTRGLSFDAVKLNGDLMSDVARDHMDSMLATALIEIGGGLGKQVIATRVGDPETLAWCREQGVDFVQGYELGRPAPAEEALALPGSGPRAADVDPA